MDDCALKAHIGADGDTTGGLKGANAAGLLIKFSGGRLFSLTDAMLSYPNVTGLLTLNLGGLMKDLFLDGSSLDCSAASWQGSCTSSLPSVTLAKDDIVSFVLIGSLLLSKTGRPLRYWMASLFTELSCIPGALSNMSGICRSSRWSS
jgi:hypothetical protein